MPLPNVAAWPKHMFRATVSLNGRDLGEFDALAGSGTSADVKKYRGGGSRKQRTLPALVDTKVITLTRGFHADRDDLAFYETVSGRPGTIRFQPLDTDLNPYGAAVTRNGTVSDYSGPDHDVDDGEASTVVFEFTPNES